MQILFCDTLLSVRLVYLLKTALNIMRFAVPIALIIKVVIDLYKGMVFTGNEKETIIKKSGDRIIACIIIFLVPTIVNVFMSLIGNIVNTNDYDVSFATCYSSVNKEVLEEFVKNEELKLNEADKEAKQQSETYIANYKAMLKQNEEIIKRNKEAQEKAKTEADSSDPISQPGSMASKESLSGKWSKSLTDTTKQNGVYVKNGTFYYPGYKSGNPNTYSGKNCPTNPQAQGYNNKYGYNNYFYTMAQDLIAAAKKAGYNLKLGDTGCRSYATQEQYYKDMESGRAAKPGKSKHGWGIASDVTFYKNSSDKCSSSRTRSNCPGMAWVHDNAASFGLTFPLINASYKEDWHMEPLYNSSY